MNCLCGKKMALLLKEVVPLPQTILPGVKVWACPPEGCGRIFLEGSNSEVGGTWYTAEQNAIPFSLK